MLKEISVLFIITLRSLWLIKKQYNNSEKEKQPNKYKLDKELSKQTFIKVDKTINN
jgi:hypothetical protein